MYEMGVDDADYVNGRRLNLMAGEWWICLEDIPDRSICLEWIFDVRYLAVQDLLHPESCPSSSG